MRHVLDLPPLYRRPCAGTLLDILGLLALKPATFEGNNNGNPHEEDPTYIEESGVPRYLTAIIGSPLAWIEDEADREQVWDLASHRLSERSGRTAQPSFKRTFKIPRSAGDPLEIQILEPSMTEDNLGLKTWASAFLLAKRLPTLFDFLPTLKSKAASDMTNPPLPNVLELGSGTGLTGLALSMLTPCVADLTDLPQIVPNLASNVQLNQGTLKEHQPFSIVSAFGLDWSQLPEETITKYDVVVAADPLYSPEHPALVVNAIKTYLKKEKNARALVEFPLRDMYAHEREAFKDGLEREGFVLLEQGQESGYDDWGNGDLEVICWWGVWSWNTEHLITVRASIAN